MYIMAAAAIGGALASGLYEASGARKVVHSIPIVGDIAGLFGFEKGGQAMRGGTYALHGGEMVVPGAVVHKYKKKRPTRIPHKKKRAKPKSKTKAKAKHHKPHHKKKHK